MKQIHFSIILNSVGNAFIRS